MRKWHVYASTAALCLVTSPVLWMGTVYWQETGGQRIASGSMRDGKPLSPDDERLLESLPARRGFLHTSLETEDNAQAFRDREHRWSLTVSRVSAADAQALFRRELRDRLLTSDQSAVLRVAVSLMNRWDIAATLTPAEREDFASQIVARMLQVHHPDVLSPLANVLYLISLKDFRTPPDLAAKLVDRLQQEPSAQARSTLLEGLIALAQGLDEADADATAAQLTFLLEQDNQSQSLSLWAAGLKVVGDRLSPKIAGETALRIAKRMASEPDPGSLRTLASPFKAIGSRMEQNDAAQAGAQLAQGVIAEINIGRLYPLVDAFSGLGPRAGTSSAQQLGQRLLSRMQAEPSTEVIALLASALGSFGKSLPPGIAEQAAQRILTRMRGTQESSELEELANGLAVFREAVGSSYFEAAGRILAGRLAGKSNAHEVAALASALSLVVEPISTGAATEFARLVARLMVQEHDPAVLLRLSTGLIALAKHVADDAAGDLATQLLARMQVETGSDALRTLSFSIGALAKGAGESRLDRAGVLVAAQMAGQSDPNMLRDLVSALVALGNGVREKRAGEAAPKLVRQVALQETADALINLTESLRALVTEGEDDGDDKEIISSDAPAQVARFLIGRMLQAQDSSAVRRLNLVMHPVNMILSADAAMEFVPQLVERIAREQDTDLRRAFGEVLGDLPVEELASVDLERLRPVFELPNAPCRIALGVSTSARTPEIARQLLNPLCSETSWVTLAAAFGERTQEPLLSGGQDDESLAYFHQLIVADDEGERSTDKSPSPQEIHVDFNKLSEVLEPLRPAEQVDSSTIARWSAIVPLLLGLFLIVLAYRERQAGNAMVR